MLDRVLVRGKDVVSAAGGVCSSIRIGDAEYSTRSGIATPHVELTENLVTVAGIRFGGGPIAVEERWSFRPETDHITWRITRKYLSGGTLDDSALPGWSFASRSTWTGALLDTGGVAWFKLFDKPLATYGVHTGGVTFWNTRDRTCLRIVPRALPGGHLAARFTRQSDDTLSFSHTVTQQELTPKHGLARFLPNRQDVWAPFQVTPGETSVELAIYGLDYDEAYDRGTLAGVDGNAVREICNTIARIGAVDAKIHGSNGWYSGYAVLQEQWLAQLGLAIDDPSYFRSYAETLDYQRDRAIGADGRVKPRWSYTAADSMHGTYDRFGFYECQWGYMLDSQPDWVINVAEQFDFTGDLAWLRSHQAACRRVLEYMLRRDSNANSLVEVMTDSHREGKGCDWLDVVWASFEVASINAQMYQALVLWADCEQLLGNSGKASRYRQAAQQLKMQFNKTADQGGFWNPDRRWYVHWRDKDGSIHGDNLVLHVNFMAIAYGLCDEPERRHAILTQVEAAMQKEKLFFWPACIYPYQEDEGLKRVNWPFPSYENGDIFLAWGEVATRAYVQHDPAIALRYVQNVLAQYKQDGLAFQRYLRRTQTGAGNDILANNCSPVVGLYRNIYGVQPKWNRLYLDPHLTSALNGTQLKYWLRDQRYTMDLSTERCRIAAADFAASDRGAFAVNVKGDTLEYFSGRRGTPSMAVTRTTASPIELRIDAWPAQGVGERKWTAACRVRPVTARHALFDLAPRTRYELSCDGAPSVARESDTQGSLTFETTIDPSRPQSWRLDLSPLR